MELNDREKAVILDALEILANNFRIGRMFDEKAEADLIYRKIAESVNLHKES